MPSLAQYLLHPGRFLRRFAFNQIEKLVPQRLNLLVKVGYIHRLVLLLQGRLSCFGQSSSVKHA